jgi:hypothetical protein
MGEDSDNLPPPKRTDWREMLEIPLFLVVIGASVGLILALGTAIGQSLAVGRANAVRLHGWEWLRVIALAIGFMGALGIVLTVLGVIFRYLSRKKWAAAVGNTIFFAFLGALGLLLSWVIIHSAFTTERAKHRVLAKPTPADAAAASSALQEQDIALQGLSKDAQELLARLDKTIDDTRTARMQLAQTIATVERQRETVAQTRTIVGDLLVRQATIQDRTSRIRELLGGQEPISRLDLERAGRSGLWQGVLLGVLTSVAGSFIYKWLTVFRFRKRSANRHTKKNAA